MESGMVCLLTKFHMAETLQVRFEVLTTSDSEDNYFLGCDKCIMMLET